MSVVGDILNLLLLQPLINLVVGILRILEIMHMPGSLGFSIIILTFIVKLLTWPFTSSQLRIAQKRAIKMIELAPLISQLKQKHKDDKLAFSQAQNSLFKEHGISPTAGCLPALIPIILLFPLYQVIFALFGGSQGLEKINYFLYFTSWHLEYLPDPNFFGINLTSKPSDFAQVGILILTVPLITAALTFIQSKMMVPAPIKKYPSDSPKEKKEKDSTEEAMEAVQGQMVYMMPIMFGFFSWQFPLGLALYWNTLTALSIVQQYMVTGWGGLANIINKIPLKKV